MTKCHLVVKTHNALSVSHTHLTNGYFSFVSDLVLRYLDFSIVGPRPLKQGHVVALGKKEAAQIHAAAFCPGAHPCI